jgi:hypothetical protein
MEQKLPNGLSFIIAPADNKLRLIISYGTDELACRKETRGNIKRFLASEETTLFKGRLQLRKDNEVIILVLKGKDVGAIEVEEFGSML